MEVHRPIRILGTAQLRSAYGILGSFVQGSDEDVRQFLTLAQKIGFSAFDTAPSYGDAEESLGSHAQTSSIHTKFDPGMSPEASITASLKRLKRSMVDVVYLHDPMAPLIDNGRLISEAAQITGTLFRRLGTSVYSMNALAASLDRPEIGVIQVPVNPLWRELMNSLPPRSPERPLIFGRSLLAQGLLVVGSGRLAPEVRHLQPFIQAFEEACRAIGRSIIEAAILWSRDQDRLDGHIIGAASIEQLREVASAFDAPPLSMDERAVIDDIPLPSTAIFDPRTWT